MESSGGHQINWVIKLSITNTGITWHCVLLDMMQNKAHSITSEILFSKMFTVNIDQALSSLEIEDRDRKGKNIKRKLYTFKI